MTYHRSPIAFLGRPPEPAGAAGLHFGAATIRLPATHQQRSISAAATHATSLRGFPRNLVLRSSFRQRGSAEPCFGLHAILHHQDPKSAHPTPSQRAEQHRAGLPGRATPPPLRADRRGTAPATPGGPDPIDASRGILRIPASQTAEFPPSRPTGPPGSMQPIVEPNPESRSYLPYPPGGYTVTHSTY